MNEITLIFPDQLYEEHPGLNKKRKVVLAEEFLYFRVQNFHFQKLVMMRAAMRAYAFELRNKGYQVEYIDSTALQKRGALFEALSKMRVDIIHFAEVTDEWLTNDFHEAIQKNRTEIKKYPSPGFLCHSEEIFDFFRGKKTYSMAQFYAYQRKKLGILMDSGKPVGGKFSFDAENRKKIPKGHQTPDVEFDQEHEFIDEAVAYIEKEFPRAIGSGESFLYPVTRTGAKKALNDFVEERLCLFGDYEDAIRKDESFLYHSVLSPLLNMGLLTPREVIDAVLVSYQKGKAPLNSVEGFVRQVIGWREYVRACYLTVGKRQRTQNYLKHKRPLPDGFWNGTTGIEPIDATIKRVIKTGYCHHIERLMILGNFLLLLEVDPNEVYRWFMGYFVDAYDWVMVPNVYGMSQYADGGLITTKPYISGSNYIFKMSDYKKGEWAEIWDGLFWRFLSKHKRLFSENPRTNMLLEMFEKNRETLIPKIVKAEKYFHLVDRMP